MPLLLSWFYWLVGPTLRRRRLRRERPAREAMGLQLSTWGWCPRCGFDGFDMYEVPHFTCTKSGRYAPPGDDTVHWFEGVQTCPRCNHHWEVADSD
jgi:hypothetical protein